MSVNLVTSEELLKVEAIAGGLRELAATVDGREALTMAQAGLTYPDDIHAAL